MLIFYKMVRQTILLMIFVSSLLFADILLLAAIKQNSKCSTLVIKIADLLLKDMILRTLVKHAMEVELIIFRKFNSKLSVSDS